MYFCWLLLVGGVLFEYSKGVIHGFYQKLQFLIKANNYSYLAHFYSTFSYLEVLKIFLLLLPVWLETAACLFILLGFIEFLAQECVGLDALEKPSGINNLFSFLVLTSPWQFSGVQFYMLDWLKLFNCHRDFHFLNLPPSVFSLNGFYCYILKFTNDLLDSMC